MSKVIKSILSIVLVLSMMFCVAAPAFAVNGEEYICDLRLIYAEDYDEAKDILKDSEFSDYKLFKENLNEDTDEIGVWIAYKTTDDIEDAITDIAVMQMNGGYTEGNYQEMIKQSYEEYLKLGDTYLEAIKYFIEAYDAGHYLAKAAYRQLNFYNVVSEGVPEEEIPTFEGKRLGDIFYGGIGRGELATMFMEGNSYVLENIRSLISMGVAYNEDGKTYLQKVAESAAKVKADPQAFADEDYDDLAGMISTTLVVIRDMIKEVAAFEQEMNYTDDEMTEQELIYAEHKALADRMRDVEYLDGKTLYQFVFEYQLNSDDYSTLYPLVDALNDGQKAMTNVAHYYDVVRYSMSDFPEEELNGEIDKLEETYSKKPVNVYAGVDRTIYDGTYALTTAASRAGSYSEQSFEDFLNANYPSLGVSAKVVGATGSILMVWAICRTLKQGMSVLGAKSAVKAAQSAVDNYLNVGAEKFGNLNFFDKYGYHYVTDTTTNIDTSVTLGDIVDSMFDKYTANVDLSTLDLPNIDVSEMGVDMKLYALQDSKIFANMPKADQETINSMFNELAASQDDVLTSSREALMAARDNAAAASKVSGFTSALYIVGGIMMLYSSIVLGVSVYNYYHPDYDDIPLAMVDMKDTVDGDRYIKYDVVFNAEINEDGIYEAADLNAFEAERWNALYYTKSYEAGKPLLADTFSVSNTNNKPKTNYAPVHRFGELVCYNLNKYNFDYNTNIYLSVKQSKNDKAAVADVPQVVGSMFSAGFLFLAGGIGAALGVGGTLATMGIVKKKKSKPVANAADTSENA